MKETIKSQLESVINKFDPGFKGDVLLEVPENKENGDYATNVAFILTKMG